MLRSLLILAVATFLLAQPLDAAKNAHTLVQSTRGPLSGETQPGQRAPVPAALALADDDRDGQEPDRNPVDRQADAEVKIETLIERRAERSDDDDPVSVAVLDFDDKGPSVKLAPLRMALAEMLTGDLSQFTELAAVERLRVGLMLSEFELGQSGLTVEATAQRAGKALSADYLIFGDFSSRDQTVTVDAKLQRVGAQEPSAHWKLSAPASRLVDLEQRLLERVLATLGIDSPTRRSPPTARAGKSPTVAILSLHNRSADIRLAAMEHGFADILQANLGALSDVQLVERQEIARILEEQQLAKSGLADTQTAVKLGKLLGAQRLVFGSFFEAGQNLRIELRLADTETGSVLEAESSFGPTEEFAKQLEDLALRLAVDLAVSPPENAAQLVEAATPVRKLEAALYFAEAEQDLRHRRYPDAARNFERILLVEPENLHAGIGRLKSWVLAFDYDRAVEAGTPLISRKFTGQQSGLKYSVYDWYERALSKGLRVEELKSFYKRVEAEFPKSDAMFRLRMTLEHLTGEDRRTYLKLQTRIDEARQDGPTEDYHLALIQMYGFHLDIKHHNHHKFLQIVESNPATAKEMAETSKQHATAAFELYKLILQEAKGSETDYWRTFSATTVGDFTGLTYLTMRGPLHIRPVIYSTGQRIHYLNVAIETFGWNGKAVYKAFGELAENYRRRKQWDELIEAWQYLFEHPHDFHMYGIPESWDPGIHQRGSPSFIDEQIELLIKIAGTQERELKDREAAAQTYRRLLEEFGTNHRFAVHAAHKLHELGESWESPESGVLIWGGRGTVNRMWDDLLEPMGYSVHSVLQHEHSAPHLSPYRLVVLAHPVDVPYEPRDILALKNYVATGGSLLCVVSPGWHPATTGIHNSLLQLFNVKADHEMVVRAHSTEVVPHPITNGIAKAMAKCAVNLHVPDGAALIHCGDRTVLGAMPYGAGRVVIASFGQWYFPHVRALLLPLSREAQPLRSVPRLQRPLESGEGLQHPLLKNVLAWLLDPLEQDEELIERRRPFVAVNRLSLETRFGLADEAALLEAMERLVADAEPGRWKETALWTAGEAFLQGIYREEGKDWARDLPKYRDDGPREPRSQYFQRLVEQFPDSPLRAFAQWRLAECERREQMNASGSIGRFNPNASATTYDRVEAPTGSYAWAWTQLRIGQTLFGQRKCEEALRHFDALAEQMDVGPEKLFGIFSAAACHEAMGNEDQSQHYFRLIAGFPDLAPRPEHYSQWGPVRAEWGVFMSLHRTARDELGESQYQRYVKKFGKPEE